MGLTPLRGANPGETHTLGLEGLAQRCSEYYAAGARFAKWRAALSVPPSDAAVEANAAQLADYAAVCQAVGMVPIVEPELLVDGAHSAVDAEAATVRVLSACISALRRRGVVLEATLLKPQMAVPGVSYCGGPKPGPEEVAERTLRALSRSVPPAVPGIVFLSGGQSEEEATLNLNAINVAVAAEIKGACPWALSFSFGRALQASVLRQWADGPREGAGSAEVVARCRATAAALARANGKAARGEYLGPHPTVLGGKDGGASLHEDFRGWSGKGPVAT
jgi:fructose-bisphosphate aldolase, class I